MLSSRTRTAAQAATPSVIAVTPTPRLWLRRPPRLYVPQTQPLWMLHAAWSPHYHKQIVKETGARSKSKTTAAYHGRIFVINNLDHTNVEQSDDGEPYQLVDLVTAHQASPHPTPSSPPASPETLTAREFEVLCALDTGMSNKEVASALVLSIGTVKWHLNNLYGKLGVTSRTQALACARALGLI